MTSARTLHQQFASGERSAVEIAEQALTHIQERDTQVGAFLEVLTDRVYKQAKKLDEKRTQGKSLGKLAGVPVAVKDNIHLRGVTTTCGSQFLTNYRAPFDATVVSLMEEEDALLIGKTNLDEFAMGSSTEHSALQATKNPWNLTCVPGGSSGGSAAAVAARMVPIALGSDTGGSVRQPGAFCGVVGFKPTYGRVSRYGLVAFGSSLDQIGPLTTSVSDAALVMEVLGKHCPMDSTSLPTAPEHYTLPSDLQGIRFGVPWKFLEGLSTPLRTNFETALTQLQDLGAAVLEVDLEALDYGIAAYYILAPAEASTNLARFDGIRYGCRSERAATLGEVYEFSKEEGFGPEVKRRILLGTYVLSAGYQDAYYRKAQRARGVVVAQYRRAFKHCDLIAMPTTPSSAFAIGAVQDPIDLYLADVYTVSANLAGLPSVSVPSGFDSNRLPLGLQLIGPQQGDVQVLAAAHAYEQATRFSEQSPELVQ